MVRRLSFSSLSSPVFRLTCFLSCFNSPSPGLLSSRRSRILLRAGYVGSEGEGHLARRASNSQIRDNELALQTSYLRSRDLPSSPNCSSDVLLHRRFSYQHLRPRRYGEATLDARLSGGSPRRVSIKGGLRRGINSPGDRIPQRRNLPSSHQESIPIHVARCDLGSGHKPEQSLPSNLVGPSRSSRPLPRGHLLGIVLDG